MTFLHIILQRITFALGMKPEKQYMQLPYFYEPTILPDTDIFTLSEETSKHCVQVLRMQNLEKLQLTNGKGLLLTAEITHAHKKQSVVKINASEFFIDNRAKLCMAIAPTKNNGRLEWVLEKMTEIGVQRIVLINSQRTERSVIKIDRLNGILISAMLQSRQVYLPELSELIDYNRFIQVPLHYDKKYIAHCLEDNEKILLKNMDSSASKIILIGPEGDFTQNEINLAKEKEFMAVSLGDTRLRTETATLVAAVLLNY